MNWKKGLAIFFGVTVLTVGSCIGYAVATVDSKLMFPATPMPDIDIAATPELIEEGRYLIYGPGHCAMCHSTDDRTRPDLVKPGVPLSGGLEFAMGPIATTWARNLTPDPKTGIGQRSDRELARTLRTGVLHDGKLSIMMRLAASRLSEHDIRAVIAYLRSVEAVEKSAPEGEFGLLGKILFRYMVDLAPRGGEEIPHAPPSDTPSLERGKYLAENVALCVDCHSQFDMSTFQSVGPRAGGSLPDPSHGEDSDMEYVAPNLTSHPTGITGRMDEDQLIARFKAGRAFASSIMPWEAFAVLTESDVRSIHRYLASLPPVDNDVGPTYRKRGWKKPE